MEALLRKVQIEYDYTDFEIAQIKYFWQVLFSESSKLLLLLLFYIIIGHPIELIIALTVLFPLRIFCGGIHCKHYWSCFLTTFVFILLCTTLPKWYYPGTTAAMIILFACMLLHYYYAPVTSIYRPALSQKNINISKFKSFVYILFSICLVFLVEMNAYVAIGFWTIVLQTLQLVIGYYLRKDVKKC